MATLVESTMSLLDIRNKTLFLTRESIATFPNIDDIINDGLSMVWKRTHLEPLEISKDTTIGLNKYDLPNADLSGGNAVVSFAYIDYTDEIGAYNRVDLSEAFFEVLNTDDDADIPANYFIAGDDFFLKPSPDAVYSLHIGYKKDFTKLVNDGDRPSSMSENEINAAIYYTCYMLKLSDDEYQAADRYKAMFDEAMVTLTYVLPGVYPFEQLYGSAI
jgi:hypothetical protein